MLQTDVIKAEAVASYGSASPGDLGRDIHGQMVGWDIFPSRSRALYD